MTNFRRSAHNIFVWSYERGTLPYDILCALILAFVFFYASQLLCGEKNRKAESSLPEHNGTHSKRKNL